jgi:hypothetical protein
VLQLVEGFVPEAAWLSDSDTLTYLHSCISTRRHRVRVPEVPMYLDAILVDEPLVGGLDASRRTKSRAPCHSRRVRGRAKPRSKEPAQATTYGYAE